MPTILITGANRGIGLALAERFQTDGDHVIAVCRHSSPGLDVLGVQVEAGVDVTDGTALTALGSRLRDTRIDVLVLNAGVLSRESFGEVREDGFAAMRHQFEVNALGPLRVVEALRGHLADGAKIGILSSRMGSVADNDSGGYYGYRASKAAVNAIGRSLAIDLKPQGVAVFLLHPGYVSTDMTGRQGDSTPAQAAAQLVERLNTLTLAQSGTFWHANGTELPW